MPEWLVAVLSSAGTLLVALLTTWLNARNARKSLIIQLEADERRNEKSIEAENSRTDDARTEARRVLLFESRRESALEFLTAFRDYGVNCARMLGFIAGATYMVKHENASIDAREIESKAESDNGIRERETRAVEALSAVSLYFPSEASKHAAAAFAIESKWVRDMKKHYLEGADDPGPNPRSSSQVLEEFVAYAQTHLGVESEELERE